MPKHTRDTNSHRYSAPIPVSLAQAQSNMAYYGTRGQTALPASYYDGLPAVTAAQAAAQAQASSMSMASASYHEPYAVTAPLSISAGATVGSVGSVGSGGMQLRASSGAWSPQEDQALLQARAQGQNWSQIQQNFFPGKTPNACRKRHERLMERKGADTWDSRKMERMAREYMTLRK